MVLQNGALLRALKIAAPSSRRVVVAATSVGSACCEKLRAGSQAKEI